MLVPGEVDGLAERWRERRGFDYIEGRKWGRVTQTNMYRREEWELCEGWRDAKVVRLAVCWLRWVKRICAGETFRESFSH